MKRLALFLLFVFPFGVLLFLNFFGENEFRLPVLEAGAYREDSLFIAERQPGILVFGCLEESPEAYKTIAQLDRIFEMLGEAGSFCVKLFVPDEALKNRLCEHMYLNKDSDKITWVFASKSQARRLMDKMIPDQADVNRFALIDGRKRLRGTFVMTDPREADRLNVEIQILIQEKKEEI